MHSVPWDLWACYEHKPRIDITEQKTNALVFNTSHLKTIARTKNYLMGVF